MKICQLIFYYFALIRVIQLHAADSTNTASIQESWETISNRWHSVPLEKIKQAAETNEFTAQYYLANEYSDGLGVSKDNNEAFKWMKLVAQQGMARAQRKLGWMFQNGLGTKTNLDEAVGWYQKAAQQGDAQAQFNLGWMYENGVSVSQDYGEASKFYLQAAEQGHAMAQNNLGWLYKNRWGVPDGQVEAVKWFQKSAEQGEKLAAENLAWMYAQGAYGTNVNGQGAAAQIRSGGIAPDHDLAEKWMRQAVDLNAIEGQYKFGNLLYSEVDKEGHQDTNSFPAAAGLFRKAAEQGYDKAQYQLAEMYNNGQLGDDQRSNCIPWYLKAAAQGNADAQAEIGKLPEYYPNSPLLKSVNPIDSLKESAEQGNLTAQFDLAFRYRHGDGVPKDDVEAFKWMEKAAQHDVSSSTIAIDAQYYLGLMYEKGEGVTKDLTNALHIYFFYREVVVNGNKPEWIGTKPEPYCRLGQMFEKGEGVPQDDSLAATNYFMALKFGFFPTSDDTARCTAIESLLNLYVQGRGLPADTNMISQQLNEIKRNHPITTAKGQFLFGQIYEQGKIVPQNLVESAAWFRLAANQNLDDARTKLKQVELEMSPAQKEAANSQFSVLEKRVDQAKKSYEQLENYRLSHSW
jgi:TPR repeat protein